MKLSPIKFYRLPLGVSILITFAVSLTIYLITADPGASYWDCPEYITLASKMEVGHSPGNPIWMLAMRVATIPFPPEYHALVVNFFSCIFMAMATAFLCGVVFMPVRMALRKYKGHFKSGSKIPDFIAVFISIGASLCFAFCDSAWFSAVEAEVYAMSTFLMALSLWILTLWWFERSEGKRLRLLVLLAYVTGISLGVHQLNLLLIPVFALVILYRRYSGRLNPLKSLIWLLVSVMLICVILMGLMPGSLRWAGEFEIFFVNAWGWAYDSGVIVYCGLLLLLAVVALGLTLRFGKACASPFVFLFLWLSGSFLFSGNFVVGAVLSFILTFIVCEGSRISNHKVFSGLMMLLFILIGYSSFGMIMIRARSNPPMNQGAPDNIFALASYIAREQYGSTPLIYGRTPFSKPLLQETIVDGHPQYRRFALKKGLPDYKPFYEGAALNYRSNMLSAEDSASNRKILERGHGYLISDYNFTLITTPELDMWFPRITSPDSYDIEAYEGWAGMTKENMPEVPVSEVMDSTGKFLPKMRYDGVRNQNYSHKPTYLQNFRFFVAYQSYYMYFRYLFWNFIGRQNDFHSTGEIDHGNFVTGFNPLDDYLIGDTYKIPPELLTDNKGYNRYFGIPFLFGLIGICYLLYVNRRSRRLLSVVALIFFMTGLAIVIYINQSPGEPRERDYTFLGSYMAYAMWIAAGFTALSTWFLNLRNKRMACVLSLLVCLAVPTLMALENFDDHDRRGRFETTFFATSLTDFEHPAVIFTYGDNTTFPVWYVSEVLGKGKQHNIIDATYITSPTYIANLKRLSENPLETKAPLSEILFNKYIQIRIPNEGDTQAMALSEALETMYSSPESKPILPASLVKIPSAPGDSVTIDLYEFSGGSPFLSFQQLMVLDVMATQMESKNPKAVFFPSILNRSFYKPLEPALRDVFYGKIYAPRLSDEEIQNLDVKAVEREIAKFGSLKARSRYTDPVIDDMSRRYRGEMILAGRRLLDAGNQEIPKKIIGFIEENYPYNKLLPGTFTRDGETVYEGEQSRDLLYDLSIATEDKRYSEMADSLNNLMDERKKQMMDYYQSLTPEQRKSISYRTLRLLQNRE